MILQFGVFLYGECISYSPPPTHPFIAYKEEFIDDDFLVEYEVLPAYSEKTYEDLRRNKISENINDIELLKKELEEKIEVLNVDIERLTNHADGLDYAVAVGCGVLCGLIDSFVVGEFDFKSAKADSNKQVNQFIEKFAKLKGYEDKGKGYKGAVEFLEKKFKVPQDNVWKGNFSSTKTHHLDDFAHHPSLLGLVSAVVVQLFRTGVFVTKDGKWHFALVETKPEDLLKVWLPIIISGILNWLVNIAEKKYEENTDKEIPKPIRTIIRLLANTPAAISLLKIANNWFGHLVSDMAGASTSGEGMGIPGLFLSVLKEFSSIPPLNMTGLPKFVNDCYTKQKLDLRSEIAVLKELGRQALPVLLGDVIVRCFYFVRHLVEEIKVNEITGLNKENLDKWKKINWSKIVPFNNRTIVRMMTIEAGTFTAIDLADAAIRSAVKNGPPNNPLFWKDFVLRVNFVGVGRFVIAVGTDIGMGIKRQKLIKERMQYKAEGNMLQVSKVSYLQEDMWIETTDTANAIEAMCQTAEKSMIYFVESWDAISESLENIQEVNVNQVENNNPGFIDDLKDSLE